MSHHFISGDAVALSAATAKSLVELGSGAERVRIKEWWVEFDGVTTSNTPVKVEVGRFSAGVTTATTVTAEKMDPADDAATSTIKHVVTVEGAGTADDIIIHRIPPTMGYHYVAPPGQELTLSASTFFRIRATAAQTVNATWGLVWESV